MYTMTRTKWNDVTKKSDVIGVDNFAVGYVLFWSREHVQVMSDIWEDQLLVTLWNTEKNAPERVFLQIGETVVPDASPDIVRAYVRYESNRAYEHKLETLRSSYWKSFAQPSKGSVVRVTRGRAKGGVTPNDGKTYPVFHVMEKNYSEGYKSSIRPLLGIALDDEKHEVIGKNGNTYQSYKNIAWVWAHNCEVVGVDERLEGEMDNLRSMAKAHALHEAEKAVQACINAQRGKVAA